MLNTKLLAKILMQYRITTIVLALTITLLRLAVIHYYVDWRYLWGGDQVPVLNQNELVDSIFNFEIIWRNMGTFFIPQMTLVLLSYIFKSLISIFIPAQSFSVNISGWIVNSLWFFFASIVLYYAVSAFKHLNARHKILMYALILLFFAFNPWSTTDTFKSYLGSTSFIAALSLALYAYYVRLLRAITDKELPNMPEMLFIVSVTLILSAISPAGTVRMFAKTFILFIMFILVALVSYRMCYRIDEIKRSMLLKSLAYSLIPLVISALAIALYVIAGYVEPLAHRVESVWGQLKPPQRAIYPSYATIINALKGMNTWIAFSLYMPYREIYQRGIIASLMLLWPLVALGLPLIILREFRFSKALRFQLLMLELMAVFAFTWGTAGNPPLSSIKPAIVNLFPLMPKVLPWSVSIDFAKFIYITLTSYVISFLISRVVLSGLTLNHLVMKKALILLLTIVLVGSLLATALPVFNGMVFGQYFNESIKGFYLPQDYEYVKNIKTRYYEHLLLLPSTPTYTSTSWGWQGSIAWYHQLNPGLLAYTFAPYLEYTNWSRVYSELSHPQLIPKDGVNLVRFVNVKRIRAWGGKILNVSLHGQKLIVEVMVRKGVDHLDLTLPLCHPLDISMYNFININITILEPRNISIAPWFAIWSGKVGGWHIFPKVKPPVTITKTYGVGLPDKPWPLSTYYPENITGFVVRLKFSEWSTPNSHVNVTIIVNDITAFNKGLFAKNYLEKLKLLNIKYVVIDKSLRAYNKYYSFIDNYLNKEAEIAFKGSIISVYSLLNKTKPINLVNCSTEPIILKSSPRLIVLKLERSCPSATIVLPILYQKTFPQPFEAYIKQGENLLPLEPLDFEGLLAFKLPSHVAENVIIVVRVSSKFMLLYITYLAYTLLPLPLLLLALTAYARKRLMLRGS